MGGLERVMGPALLLGGRREHQVSRGGWRDFVSLPQALEMGLRNQDGIEGN